MRVILPGSYDPITVGHLDIIRRASKTFDEVYVVVFINPDKKYTFSVSERIEMISLSVADLKNVKVDFSPGYVVDYMRENRIDKIVKGYRNQTDLEYEKKQAEYNKKHGGYETELWKCDPTFEHISSTEARMAIAKGEDLSSFLSAQVIEFIKKH